ncbi:hypothetical protein MVEN_01885000 [Mycena venus]|uniref:P-loop containing nucleoside triphosphate hydrolase protein n=1 Tax=Mycena venus TaxID=2733690 RepID=A0A8H6XI40_9AGAR|nr:hypothetical protein MVEN_01885000 [Mycena venus]
MSSVPPSPLPSSHEDEQMDRGYGLSDPQLAQVRRKMLDLINRLHNTGVQTDIDLPQIVAIGSQSAGKSSLIEAISGITLPRAARTCTRCPIECRLSHSTAPWKCIVELRFLTDKDGHALGQPCTETFGDPIFDKSQVEERIRRAQRAILHPSTISRNFLTDDDEELLEMSFSTNYISLQISGPGIADLSFVDLPGLIASVSSRGGNETDIEMVKGLVAAYIAKPSCVILLTVACETDFENQGAHHLAKKYDPEGKRTIGVLTKPDRIPAGDEESWLPLLRHEQEFLENNWYCVKQPSSQELNAGITWEEARSRENSFFSTKAPWTALDSTYRRYLGTANLVNCLSLILSDLISKRLPQIQIELENTIQQTRGRLQNLPKPPSCDPITEVTSLLHVFVNELNKILEGTPRAGGLPQSIRPAQERFRCDIRRTAPDFRPFESHRKRNSVHIVFPDPPFLGNEDGYEHSWTYTPSKAPMEGKKSASTAIFIDQVLLRAHAARTRELPGHYPFAVQKSYILEFNAKWGGPAHALCESIHKMLSEHVNALIREHFSTYGQGVLEQRVTVIIQDYMQQRVQRATALISKLLQVEAEGPLTMNEHYFSDYKDKFLSYYKSARQRDQNPLLATAIAAYMPEEADKYDEDGPPTSNIQLILSKLAAIGLSGVKAEDLVKLLPPDSMDPALNIMADVRAYFQVAYKRFVDNILAAIDHELVRGIGRDMLQTLHKGLGIAGPDGFRICQELAKENPGVAGKREELLKRLERLEIAKQELVRVGL